MAASIRISSALYLPTCPVLIWFFHSRFRAVFSPKKLSTIYGTNPPWDSNLIPLSTGLNIAASESYHSQDSRSSPRCGNDISFTMPGCYRMGIGYSPYSDYRAYFLSARSSILISAVLIDSIRCRQLICLNALRGLRNFVFSQIHHSEPSGHQII
jgi:hypothetical protein